MTIIDAVAEGLRLMSDGLGSKKIDEGRIRAYVRVLREDDLLPDDVLKAADWFNDSGDGRFPESPIFRRRCQIERSIRVGRERNAAYKARLEVESDPFADPDEWVTREDAHAILARAIAKIDSKFTDGARMKSRRELDREVAALKGGA